VTCSNLKQPSKTQKLDFKYFTIQAPTSWVKVKQQGIDSYVGAIAIDNQDTLQFALGWYSNDLSEDKPMILERSVLKYFPEHPIDTSQFIMADNYKDVDFNKYRKIEVKYEIIDGYKAKIVFPRVSGDGKTGIYIDSVWQSGGDVDRFNLYGNNLKPVNEIRFLKAISTIKFHQN